MASIAQDETPSGSEISRDPTAFEKGMDFSFRGLAWLFGAGVVLLVGFIFFEITRQSLPAMSEYGLDFLTVKSWNRDGEYGILAHIWGTLYTSILGLIIGSIFGVSAALFLSEGFLSGFLFWLLSKINLEYHPLWGKIPDQTENVLKHVIQLLAAIPSVIYGLWGIFVVIPLIRPACNWLHEGLSWVPFFSTRLSGPGVLPASIVLAIMVMPIITAVSRDALVAVPHKIREAAYGLGATRWEAILGVILPTAMPGIFGSILLGFGRALGETMALAMLAGLANQVTLSLFAPVNTLAALLAMNFGEARGPLPVGRLMYAALVLLVITFLVNAAGSYILKRATLMPGEKH